MKHPVQKNTRGAAKIPEEIALRAYEVYSHIFAPQPALITGNCRGGFGAGELVALLYARSFPKEQWKEIAVEALREIENL